MSKYSFISHCTKSIQDECYNVIGEKWKSIDLYPATDVLKIDYPY